MPALDESCALLVNQNSVLFVVVAAEVHAAQLLQQSKAANPFIVMMYVRPAKEYHRRVRDLVSWFKWR